MTLICHGIIDGPCITQGATAWGDNVEELDDLKRRISNACAEIRQSELRDHRLSVRIDFYLQGRRLQQNDLDNMAKVVLDAAFSGDPPQRRDTYKDSKVWRLELCEIDNPKKEFTEIWVFDEGKIE